MIITKRQIVRELLHCYDVTKEDPIKENQHNIKIIEFEGEIEVEGPRLE
jgi:hypothetical protein